MWLVYLLRVGYEEPCRERGETQPDAGVLMLTKEDDGNGRTIRESDSVNSYQSLIGLG
jgi:hypothetical protein